MDQRAEGDQDHESHPNITNMLLTGSPSGHHHDDDHMSEFTVDDDGRSDGQRLSQDLEGLEGVEEEMEGASVKSPASPSGGYTPTADGARTYMEKEEKKKKRGLFARERRSSKVLLHMHTPTCTGVYLV